MPFELPPIRERIPSRTLVTVAESFLPRLFGRLDDAIGSRVAYLKRRNKGIDTEKVRLFEWLLDNVDHAAFAAMQEDFLAADALDFEYLKFIDPVYWFEDMVATANRMGLHEHPPGRVLDLGTGAGHFLVVARFHGHEGIGTGVIDYGRNDPGDDEAYCEFQRQRLFTECCRLYGVTRVNHAVKAFGSLDGLPRENDWVTGFAVYFDIAPEWTLDAWRHFLDQAGGLLKPDGSLFLTLITARLPEANWAYLSGLSRNDQLGRPWIEAARLRDLPPTLPR